jgi:hypothetical protein
MSTSDDDFDRDAILARRAMFVATALAGLALGEGCERPVPCLSPPPLPQPPPVTGVVDAGAPNVVDVTFPPMPPPMPCLSIAVPEPDVDAGFAPPAPMPCLSIAPPRDAGRTGTRRDASLLTPPPRPRTPPPGPEARPMPCLTPVRPQMPMQMQKPDEPKE